MLSGRDQQLKLDNWDKVMVYKKGDALFAFNFHCHQSYEGYWIPVTAEGDYQVVMSTDDHCYGGNCNIAHQTYTATRQDDGSIGFQVYLPSRTAIVFKKV